MFIPDIDTKNYLRIKDPYLKCILLFFFIAVLTVLYYYLNSQLELDTLWAILVGLILVFTTLQIFLIRKCSKCNSKMCRAYNNEETVINICKKCKTFIDLFIGLAN